jgi:Ice-binding-like/Putative peptidoglycan binding domain
MKNLYKNSVLTALAVSFAFGFVVPMAALAAGPAAVNLGSAGNFVVLAKAGISTTGSTAIVGDIGVSPAAATSITGFALTLPAAGAFSTSALVTGKVYAPDYANPTPTTLTTAVLDVQNAYTDAAGRAPTVTELGAGNIGGRTLVPGVYKWGTGVTIPADVTLSGAAGDVWIFQIAGNLTVSSGAKVVLAGGAQAGNVFWAVAGQTTLGTTSAFNGNILDQTAIVLNTGAQLSGRALAQTAVTLDSNMVTLPTSIVPAPVPMMATTTVVCSTTQHSCPCATGNYCLFMGAMCVNPATSCPTSSPMPTSTSVIIYPPAYTVTTSTVQTQTQTQTQTSPATSESDAVLQARLNGLLATLHSLQAQAGLQGSSILTITSNLRQGGRGNDVATLQQFLISQNKGPAAQALAAAGATGHFGSLTRAALAEFQRNVGISPASGSFGPITRAYIGTHY